MAFLWCESFDKIGSDANLLLKYPLSGSGHTFISGRLGGQAMRLSNFWSCPIPSSSTIIVGFALNWLSDNLTYRRDLLKFFEDSTLHIEVEYAGSGMGWIARRGTTQIAAVPDPVMPVNTWHYIEVKVVIHDTAGAWEIRRNGAVVGSGSGVDTRNGGTGIVNQIRFDDGFDPVFAIDDFYCLDGSGPAPLNDFLGDSLVEAFSPNAAGDLSQFTPSSGANWQCVNESSQNADTNYAASSTVGHKDLYNIEDTTRTGAVRGIVLTAWMRKDDAGGRNACISIRSGSTDSDGPTIALSNTYQAYTAVFANNPDTGSAWSVPALNALQIGAKVLS